MTAPEKIWRAKPYIPSHNQYGLASWPVAEHAGPEATEYTLTALSQAQVAAAYEAAASYHDRAKSNIMTIIDNDDTVISQDKWRVRLSGHSIDADLIRALTPADATAAMQAMIDKAVGEERERCAQVCDAVSLAAHLATGLAGDDEITTRVGAASYARAAEHIAAAIRKGAKP